MFSLQEHTLLTWTECVILLNFAFLFFICGQSTASQPEQKKASSSPFSSSNAMIVSAGQQCPLGVVESHIVHTHAPHLLIAHKVLLHYSQRWCLLNFFTSLWASSLNILEILSVNFLFLLDPLPDEKNVLWEGTQNSGKIRNVTLRIIWSFLPISCCPSVTWWRWKWKDKVIFLKV